MKKRIALKLVETADSANCFSRRFRAMKKRIGKLARYIKPPTNAPTGLVYLSTQLGSLYGMWMLAGHRIDDFAIESGQDATPVDAMRGIFNTYRDMGMGVVHEQMRSNIIVAYRKTGTFIIFNGHYIEWLKFDHIVCRASDLWTTISA